MSAVLVPVMSAVLVVPVVRVAVRRSEGAVGPFAGQQLFSNGYVGVLVGDQEPAGQVQGYGQAAQEGQGDETDPNDRRVDVEVVGQSHGDAAQHATAVAAVEPLLVAVAGWLVRRERRWLAGRGAGRACCAGW